MTLVDNNVCSSLAKIDRLELLPTVFESVATTPAVVEEFHRDEVSGYAFVDRIDEVEAHAGGWLDTITPTETERTRTDEILDRSLSRVDAQLIAIAEVRDERLLTDDGHVHTIASHRGVEIVDLVVLLRAACERDAITSAEELRTVLADLRREDHYEFATDDEQYLFEAFEE
ncbi:hypothetical protein [Halococcoides cellulosivorans]|uniref:hypothetical protein n=1 Tax=Halococcoides cellulosivorans TaxID=1679096 RepID=UPI001F330F3D|nr:hypothetical protein [Halococcoides cellulosivorans]